MINDLLKKAETEVLTKEDAITLLNTENKSDDFYELIKLANRKTREDYNNRAYVFSQIGLNTNPCSKNCKFCSMAESNFAMDEEYKKTMTDIEQLKETARQLVDGGTHDLFLMTTADYPVEEFIQVGTEIKKVLPQEVRLVANIGDFGKETAHGLKEAGFTGVYHIRRLGEGKDTDIDPEERIKTLDIIKASGLELYYCVEPIGPEHSYEEIADEMIRARDYGVEAMAVMRRIPVPGTPLADKGMITALELTKIEAVTRLVTNPTRSMNTHEVTPMTLIAGVNQLYAEVGANPRDNVGETSKHRGHGVVKAIEMLREAEFEMA